MAFITVRYGSNEEKLFNPNCMSTVLLSHIKKSLNYENLPETIDLANENGEVFDLFSKQREYANKFLESRASYILVKMSQDFDEDSVPNYTSLLEAPGIEKIKFSLLNQRQKTKGGKAEKKAERERNEHRKELLAAAAAANFSLGGSVNNNANITINSENLDKVSNLDSVASFNTVKGASATNVFNRRGSRIGGIGIGDITGQIGEINMMGYAAPDQAANGIHLRLKSRAFIFSSLHSENHRIVYISSDTGMVSYFAKRMAVNLIRDRLKTNIYTESNIMICATHTHSGPGGYVDNLLYHITSLGVIDEVRTAIAQGIAESVIKAHYDYERNKKMDFASKLIIKSGSLTNSSVNRSPQAYLSNPEFERSKFKTNTDNEMTLLEIRDSSSNSLLGIINWFAVHATSMNSENHFVSSDNKGFASYLWELEEKLNGNINFIAAFSQSNSGDVSPNLVGPFCKDTGESCDGNKHSCKGDITKCVSRGPEFENGGDFQSTKVIGTRHLLKAKEILSTNDATALNLTSDKLDFRHAWVNMSDINLNLDGKSVKTCKPAMGYSFAAGTTDGPGIGLAYQGANSTIDTSGLLNIVRDFIKSPSEEQIECHFPKQIFISTGEVEFPYSWQPTVLPLQIFLLSPSFVIIGFPAEITTMSGRRLRKAVKDELLAKKVIHDDAKVVIAGLSNAYSSYVTTFEEYQVQRYEGGSTIFGPHTLNAYIDQFQRLAQSFSNLNFAPRQSPPPKFIPNELKYLPKVILDTPPLFKWYGDVYVQPPKEAKHLDVVKSVFHCSHPRNQIVGKSFCSVEKLIGSKWIEIFDDSGWDTKFLWERKGAAESLCTVSWSIGETHPVASGVYRLRYFGRHKILHYLGEHDGASDPIKVII